MELQKRLMLLNPIASLAYGLWFVIQPNGYLRVIEGVQGELPAALTATYVSFGATLIALGLIQWVMRSQTKLETVEVSMVSFGAVWAIIGVGMLISLFAYSDGNRAMTTPLAQATVFFMIAIAFYLARKPKSAPRRA